MVQAYSNNLVDHHIILDLLPNLAQAYFSRHVPANLSYLQAAILLSLGLQQNDISSLEAAIQLPANQALALFNKVCSAWDPSVCALSLAGRSSSCAVLCWRLQPQ